MSKYDGRYILPPRYRHPEGIFLSLYYPYLLNHCLSRMSLQLSEESLCLPKESSCFPESLGMQIFIIQRVKARAILYPHQPPTRVITQFRQLKAVLPLLALPSGFCHRTGYLKEIYIYIYTKSTKSKHYISTLDGFFNAESCLYIYNLWANSFFR